MTTTDATPRRRPTRLEFKLLMLFHALLAGGFLVAYLTGDEDTYHMHVFAGYAVLAAVSLRLLAALLAPSGSPLRLTRPDAGALLRRLAGGKAKGRHPIYAWMAVVVLTGVGLSAVTGAVADWVTAVEDLHEGLSEFALWLTLGHAAIILALHGAPRLRNRLRGRPALSEGD